MSYWLLQLQKILYNWNVYIIIIIFIILNISMKNSQNLTAIF